MENLLSDGKCSKCGEAIEGYGSDHLTWFPWKFKAERSKQLQTALTTYSK